MGGKTFIDTNLPSDPRAGGASSPFRVPSSLPPAAETPTRVFPDLLPPSDLPRRLAPTAQLSRSRHGRMPETGCTLRPFLLQAGVGRSGPGLAATVDDGPGPGRTHRAARRGTRGPRPSAPPD